MIINGNALHLPLADCTVDSIVTDPPYGLAFMGKAWDHGVPGEPFWREALRVAKPGAYLLAFGGARTFHRLVCGIEDAGWEVRDTLGWLYGSGFPKSHDVSKAIDREAGAVRETVRVPAVQCRNQKASGGGKDGMAGATRPWIEAAQANGYHEKASDTPATPEAAKWQGFGTALKPAWEPICLARKPLDGTVAANVLRHGTGGLNIDGCRVGTGDVLSFGSRELGDGIKYGKCKPTTEGAQNPHGRWPANILHDGSEEVLAVFPMTGASKESSRGLQHSNRHGGLADIGGNINPNTDSVRGHTDNGGSAARFFYTAKASKADRDDGLDRFEERARPTLGNGIGGQPDQQRANNRNHHPTVKPTALLTYLCRLVTPPGGLVLDPFCGSGSTGRAAEREGFQFIGIDLDGEYAKIALARIRGVNGELFA